jgi:hypothetical protein
VLIQPYAEDWLEQLRLRHSMLDAGQQILMLIDGAFVPGLHKTLQDGEKRLLFASLPTCSDETRDISPILVPFDPDNERVIRVLRRCNRWQMVSAIESSESLDRLAERLSSWCVVYADKQRFNFRFPDTRRLPTILDVLEDSQRGHLAGPAVRWSYVGRDGSWAERTMTPSDATAMNDPELNQDQFAKLVEDSRTDEILSSLSRQGHAVYERPFRSHELVQVATKVAKKAGLGDYEMISWCEWFWQRQSLDDEAAAATTFTEWFDLSGGNDA